MFEAWRWLLLLEGRAATRTVLSIVWFADYKTVSVWYSTVLYCTIGTRTTEGSLLAHRQGRESIYSQTLRLVFATLAHVRSRSNCRPAVNFAGDHTLSLHGDM
jgi:hypothetical protein